MPQILTPESLYQVYRDLWRSAEAHYARPLCKDWSALSPIEREIWINFAGVLAAAFAEQSLHARQAGYLEGVQDASSILQRASFALLSFTRDKGVPLVATAAR